MRVVPMMAWHQLYAMSIHMSIHTYKLLLLDPVVALEYAVC